MSDEWSALVLLCDSAQVADGKLYILGGGWSLCGPGPFVHALALRLMVPWTQTNREHSVDASLLDEDGAPVHAGNPSQGIGFQSRFEVGRPTGIPPGTPLEVPIAINMGPIDLPSGRGYIWVIRVDGDEVTRANFRTRPAAAR